jgi:hypothetical protein
MPNEEPPLSLHELIYGAPSSSTATAATTTTTTAASLTARNQPWITTSDATASHDTIAILPKAGTAAAAAADDVVTVAALLGGNGAISDFSLENTNPNRSRKVHFDSDNDSNQDNEQQCSIAEDEYMDMDQDDSDSNTGAAADTVTLANPLLETLQSLYAQNVDNQSTTVTTFAACAATAVLPPSKTKQRPLSENRVRSIEWDQIRQRWKRRKYHYATQVDVGNAVSHQVSHRRPSSKRPRITAATTSSNTTIVAPPPQPLHDRDDEDVTDRAMLHRLLASSNPTSTTVTVGTVPDAAVTSTSLPRYADTLDPGWEYAKFPKDFHNQVPYAVPSLSVPPPRAPAVRDASADDDNVPDLFFTVRAFASTRNDSAGAAQQSLYGTTWHAEFAPSRGEAQPRAPVPRSLVVPRCLVRAAARFVLGTITTTTTGCRQQRQRILDADQRQCIRLLWKLHRKVHRLPLPATATAGSIRPGETMIPSPDWSSTALLQDHVRRQGHAWRTFGEYRWTNRSAVAARLLGIVGPGRQIAAGGARYHGDQKWILHGTSLSRAAEYRITQAVDQVVRTCSLARNENVHTDSSHDSSVRPGQPLVTPQTRFCFVPGTVPPTVPSTLRPMDVTGILYGPTDRYEHVLAQGTVDDSVWQLTLASLLARLAQAITSTPRSQAKQDSPHEPSVATLLQRQVTAVLRQVVDLNQHSLYRRLARQYSQSNLELPLAFYYRSVMAYCSYIVQGIVPPPPPTLSASTFKADQDDLSHYEDEEEDEDDDGAFMEDNCSFTKRAARSRHGRLENVVSHLLEFLEPHVKHNGLQMFTGSHLLFGQLHIAQLLPASAVEILSLPCDHQHQRTPFEKMAMLLQHLEDSHALVDALESSARTLNCRKTVLVGEWEFGLHRAARIFAHCVEREPTNVLCHAWHTATLAASLLLCSGNRAGSGARCQPSPLSNDWENLSSRVKKEPKDRNGANIDDDILYHVRRRLPKFDELRRETAQAFQLLVHLARCQQGSRAHLAVASFLEWRQVVALMVGNGGGANNMNTMYDSILALHTHHAHQWALQEATSLTLDSVSAGNNSTLDDRLDALARAVEVDPCSLEHWRALVAQLCAVACTSSEAVSCTNSDCQECSRVNDGFSIDHASLCARRQAGRWWGLHRSQWWYESLLQPNSRANPNTHASSRPIVLDGDTAQSIYAALQDALGENDNTQSVPRAASSSDCKEFDHAKHMQWLDGLVKVPTAAWEENDEIDERAAESVDHLLPTTYQERCEEAKTQDRPLDPLLLEEPDSASCEVLTYKVLIFCHLYSTLHSGVDVGIDRLIDMAWDDESAALLLDSNAVQCLRWLRRRGLDVAAVFLQTQNVGIDSLQTW